MGNRVSGGLLFGAAFAAVLALASACTDGENADVRPGGGGGESGAVRDGGALKPFPIPPANPGAGSVLFTASGEILALEGYAFPGSPDQEVRFVDGWEVKFEHLLATLDDITLSETPDKDPADQSKTDGVIAEVKGPWAVDLAKNDASYPPGKGGEGKAVPLVALGNQNKNGGKAFDTSEGTRYAFGYRVVAATPNAMNVNLEASSESEYLEMIGEGCAILVVGSAEWKGGASCSPAPGANVVLDAIPKKVAFRLCLKTMASYRNCQNPDNEGAAIAGEEHQRGIAMKGNSFVTAQLTLHTDHLFWDSIVHDSPAHFDAIAARYSGVSGSVPTVTMADLAAVDYEAIKDKNGNAIPWRNCVDKDFTPPAGNVSYRSLSIQNVGPGGDPSKGLRHLADFIQYNASTLGHLNADGLCSVLRDYPSPP